jgi:hypothetical protein
MASGIWHMALKDLGLGAKVDERAASQGSVIGSPLAVPVPSTDPPKQV